MTEKIRTVIVAARFAPLNMVRLPRFVLFGFSLLALVGCLSDGRVSNANFSVPTDSAEHDPRSSMVFAEVDAFALRHGFVRAAELDFERINPATGKLSDLNMHRYILNLRPNTHRFSDIITLQVWYFGRRKPEVHFQIFSGEYSKSSQQYIDQFRDEFVAEFSRQHGPGHLIYH